MGPRPVRHVHALTLAVLAGLLPGCTTTLAQLAESEGVSRDGLVALTETVAVGARIVGDDVEVVAFRSETGTTWTAETVAEGTAGGMSAHLVTQEGETGEAWNTLFFGTAPEGASRVVVAGPGTAGGHVTDGAWVIAFRREGVSPAELQWQVIDAAGDVIESGTGITR